jgi:hypothetical protein
MKRFSAATMVYGMKVRGGEEKEGEWTSFWGGK